MRYYEILGLTPDASHEDVKRAYFRMRRQFSPESEPERFQSCKEAYEILKNPESRRQYDDLSKHGEEIRALYERFEDLAEEEDWDAGIRVLKQIIVLAPNELMARNLLGIAYLRIEEFRDSIKAFNWLIKKDRESVRYWLNFGHVLSSRAGHSETSAAQREKDLKEARICFNRAHKLEPHNAEPLLEISKAQCKLGNYDSAIDYANKSINADGEVDYQDFDAFFFKCIIYLHADRLDKILEVVQEVEDVVPDHRPELRDHAAYEFAMMGAELLKKGAHHPAAAFLRAAMRLSPDDESIARLYRANKVSVDVLDQWKSLEDDWAIPREVKLILNLQLMNYFETQGLEEIEDPQAVARNALEQFVSNPRIVRDVVGRLRMNYPSLHDLNPNTWELAIEASKNIRPSVVSRIQSQSTSDCFIATAAFGTPDEPVIDVYRAFRENRLRSNRLGRALITLYCKVGPLGANFIRHKPWWRRQVVRILNSCAPLIRKMAHRKNQDLKDRTPLH